MARCWLRASACLDLTDVGAGGSRSGQWCCQHRDSTYSIWLQGMCVRCELYSNGRPVQYRWRRLLNAAVCLMPTTWVPCSNAANIGECKTWTQSEFCTWQNSITGQEPLKCIHSVLAQEMAKHPAKFGWLPLTEVAAVTKPRRETVEICWGAPN